MDAPSPDMDTGTGGTRYCMHERDGDEDTAESAARLRGGAIATDDLSRWLKAIAAATHTATDIDDVFRWAIDLVCNYAGWPLGHVLRLDGDQARLLSTDIWHNRDSNRYGAFMEATRRITFAAGVGLPGRVLATGN